MTALLLATVLGTTPFLVTPPFDSTAGTYQLHLNDDIKLTFGNTSGTPDAWFEWDTDASTDRLELHLPAGSDALCLVDDDASPSPDRVCLALNTNGALTIRDGDDAGAGNLYYANSFVSGNIQVGSANGILWSGPKSKFESSDDGVFEFTNNAEDQGVRLNAIATADTAAFFDESGNAAGVKPGSVTADPCGTFAEGSLFYNDTANIICYCDQAGADLKVSDDTACFP